MARAPASGPTAPLPGTPVALLLLLAAPLSAQSPSAPRASTSADPRLVQAIEWYTGVSGRVDDVRAKALLEEVSADPSDVLARMWIARVHSTGRMGYPRDEERARAIGAEVIADVRDLAASGDVEAAFLMGTAYDEALGVAQDHPEAMRWYRRAAHRGHVLATHNVGNMYRDGRGVGVDHGSAVVWWLQAARAGDAVPALRLGEAYEAGRGVPRDASAAAAWYRKAADAGNATAAVALERIGR